MRDASNDDELTRLVGRADVVRDVFEAMPLPLVGMEGPENRIVAVNRAYRDSVGRPDVVGQPIRGAFPEVEGQQAYEMVERVYETGEPASFTEWRVQLRPVGGDERVDLYFDLTLVPRRAADGTIIGVNLTAEVVTDRVLERLDAQQRTTDAVRRYEEARDVINALQRQLLPPGLPVLPSVRVAASYLLADAETAAGGDWFDAVPLGGGRVALVVGDVVGHGVAASAAMGQLRAVLQDRLDETGDVLRAIAAVDRMARRVPDAHAATVCVGVLDPADGTLEYCCAGHPPPLVASEQGSRYLTASGSGPLGTGAEYTLAHDRLEPGEAVLLYSDGIIERPGREPSASTAEMAEVVADSVADRVFSGSGLSTVERACTQSLELLVRATGHADDITLLAAQRAVRTDPLRLRLPAEIGTIAAVRGRLDAWLETAGAGPDDLTALRHAVGELVTNAVEHAYQDRSGTVRVRADITDDGHVEVEVSDDGRWRDGEPRPGRRGRGLTMAADFVEDLRVDRAPEGTTIIVRQRLSRPARLLTADQISSPAQRVPAAGQEELILVLDQPHLPGPRVRVDGPIDAKTAQSLHDELLQLTYGGTRPLTVDLTGVTLLASAGVALLYEAVGQGRDNEAPLQLYAPVGCVAQHVLTLVDLPHTTADPGVPAED